MWWAGEQVYPGRRFTKYAVLGDDIVICDTEVAHGAVYSEALKKIRVSISKSQTEISHTGSAEFAKRFLVKRLEKHLSPVTVKAVLGAHLPLNRYALIRKYPYKRFSTFRRLGGAG